MCWLILPEAERLALFLYNLAQMSDILPDYQKSLLMSASVSSVTDSALSGRQLRWAVAALSIGLGLAVLDGFIVNVALPIIARDFNVTADRVMTVVTVYQLALTLALLPLAALGDRVGYRRVFASGLVLVVVTAVVSAFSVSLEMLIAARLLQGLGAAAIMAVASALVRTIYPASLLGRGISFNAMVVAGSSAAGPTLAGAMLSVADWRWLFGISALIAIAGLLLSLRWLPDNRHQPQGFDIPSAILSVITLGALLLLVDLAGPGFSPGLTAILAVTGLIAGLVFIRRQLRLSSPLLPVDLMRQRLIALSLLGAALTFCAEMLTFVTLPFFLSEGLGHDIATTGLIFTAWPLSVMCMALITGQLADRLPAGLLGGVGLTLGCAGLVLLSSSSTADAPLEIALRMAMCGAGFVLFQVPNTRFVVATAPANRAGSVGGMMGTVRLIGQTVGASLAALLVSIPQGAPANNLKIAAAVAGAAAGVSLLRLYRGRQPVA
jgi:DHA2 family multidrug resistance protein-like MFS transporter